jgi:hypothetical protein
MSADVISLRVLNRALLARQLLLERVEMPVTDAIEHLVALQNQDPFDPYFALWSRIEHFAPEALGSLIESRDAVRIAFLRATVHLVTARDCQQLRPLLQPVLERAFYSGSPFGRNVRGLDVEELLSTGRALLEAEPLTNAQLARLLADGWPDRDANSLAMAVHYLLPLVQVPPRGIWGASGQARRTTAEAWLGRPLAAKASLEALFVRYLRAFGPASAADFRAWSGLALPPPLLESLRSQLRAFRDERGRELLDLPEASLPDPDLPAPPRFLPAYDDVALAHADRTRIVSETDRRQAVANISRATPRTASEAVFKGSFLVDGFAGGTWTLLRSTQRATLSLDTFAPLSAENRNALAAEGEALISFAAPKSQGRDISFTTPADS